MINYESKEYEVEEKTEQAITIKFNLTQPIKLNQKEKQADKKNRKI